MLPTATDKQLGSEKWSAGPTGVVLVQPKWGTYGGLVRHLWSFAGDDDRASVNQTLIEPFLNYNLDGGWYLIADIIITANWQADSDQRWTVPLGGGVGKLLKIGNQAINVEPKPTTMSKSRTRRRTGSGALRFSFCFPARQGGRQDGDGGNPCGNAVACGIGVAWQQLR
jgi:hypothetical protein